jgi:ribosomal 50S subunit-associated protein YjgA (DUF615 family)
MKPRATDPLLEEVDEMRRRIMARHDNDWRKVLAYYLEADRQRRELEAHGRAVERKSKSAA